MRAILQVVEEASVTIDNQVYANIKRGLLVFVGVESLDNEEDCIWLTQKIASMRICKDAFNKMNLSIKDIEGELLVVSQFTLCANLKKGNRPSYSKAAAPSIAIPLYKKFISHLENNIGKKVSTGVFGADMKIALVNDGPITIIMDSKVRD